MRNRTPKRALIEKEARILEAVFLDEMHHTCAMCGGGVAGVHHIIAGPNRARALLIRAVWLPLCWICNSDKAEDKATWPVPRQLALKLKADPMYFDLDEVNKLLAPKDHPNPPKAVAPEDVLPWIVANAREAWGTTWQ